MKGWRTTLYVYACEGEIVCLEIIATFANKLKTHEKHTIHISFISGFHPCSDPKAVTDVLNRAEVLMNDHPDSSLNLLRTLSFDDFQKESDRARYALLHSQALDKNYIDVTNDSLISWRWSITRTRTMCGASSFPIIIWVEFMPMGNGM